MEVGAEQVGQGKVGLAGVCIEGDEERHISTRLRTSGSRGRGSRSPAMYHACLRRRPTSGRRRRRRRHHLSPPPPPKSNNPRHPSLTRIQRSILRHSSLSLSLPDPKRRGGISMRAIEERHKSGFGTMKRQIREKGA